MKRALYIGLAVGAASYSPAARPVRPAAAGASAGRRHASPRGCAGVPAAEALLEKALLQQHRAAAPTAAGERSAYRQLSSFLGMFRGEFDNHVQHAFETARGLTPREGGGHEHIHCSLKEVLVAGAAGNHVLATYYFDGRPNAVFRQRLYRIDALPRDEQFGSCVRMQIYRLRPEAGAALAAAGGEVGRVAWGAADVAPELHLPSADVFWRWCGERFEGEMRMHSITLASERDGSPLVVRDDVALWQDALWVNDRGSTPEGAYVYGHIGDVPYKMSRVPEDHWTATGVGEPSAAGGSLSS